MGDEVKKVEKHWFMICKQQPKIEAKYAIQWCRLSAILKILQVEWWHSLLTEFINLVTSFRRQMPTSSGKLAIKKFSFLFTSKLAKQKIFICSTLFYKNNFIRTRGSFLLNI